MGEPTGVAMADGNEGAHSRSGWSAEFVRRRARRPRGGLGSAPTPGEDGGSTVGAPTSRGGAEARKGADALGRGILMESAMASRGLEAGGKYVLAPLYVWLAFGSGKPRAYCAILLMLLLGGMMPMRRRHDDRSVCRGYLTVALRPIAALNWGTQISSAKSDLVNSVWCRQQRRETRRLQGVPDRKSVV